MAFRARCSGEAWVPEDFWDGANPNPRGAAKFAKLLDEELIRPSLYLDQ